MKATTTEKGLETLTKNPRLVVYQTVLTNNPWYKPWLPQTERVKVGYLNFTPVEKEVENGKKS